MESVSLYDLRVPSRAHSARKKGPSYSAEDFRLEPYMMREQDVCRHVVNTELMMLHGHNVEGYLPPLPSKTSPRSSLVTAWSCDDQAMRQLGNIKRRGPRNPLMTAPSKPKNLSRSDNALRPHTSYCSHVCGILNLKPQDIRPHTADIILDRTNDKRLQPVKDLKGLILPAKLEISNIQRLLPFLIMKDRLEDLREESIDGDLLGLHGSASLVAGGLRKPKLGLPGNKNKSSSKNKHLFLNLDQELNEDISRILKGDLENLPDHPPTEVKIYLCSHPHDMVVEKKVLEREAYPVLREYCQKLGLELQILDSHLEGSASNPENINYHMRRLSRCQNQSVGPNYILLLGDYYGPPAIPLTFSVKDYQALHKAASVSNTVTEALFEQCYKLENNMVPPTYVLQDADKMSSNLATELHYVLKVAVHTAIQIGKFKEEREKEFATSALESLIKEGILKCPPDLAAVRTLCFHRKFTSIDEDTDNPNIADYIDVSFSDGKVLMDRVKQERLDGLAAGIVGRLGEANMKGYEVSWMGDGIKDYIPEHQVYLKQLVEDFTEGVKRLIEINHSQWRMFKNSNLPLYKEVLHHAKVCFEKSEFFVERQKLLEPVKQFLGSKDRSCYPFILFGEGGAGKSAFLAQTAKSCAELVNKSQCIAIYRKIGLTPNSTRLRSLLGNICHQLSVCYNTEPPTESVCSSTNKIVRFFGNMLELIAKHNSEKKPLFLLLDDLHGLSSKDRAKTLFWLPRVCPKNIYMIVTCHSSDEELLGKLHYRVPHQENFLEVESLSSKEAAILVDQLLHNAKRTISDTQKDSLKTALVKGTQPLLLKMQSQTFLQWPAQQIIETDELVSDIDTGLTRCLEHLQRKYGAQLVVRLAMYLTLLPTGITEVELEDAIITSSSVIFEARGRHKCFDSTLYTIIKSDVNRVLDALETWGFISQASFHGRTMWSWSHKIYKDVVCGVYYDLPSSTALYNGEKNDRVSESYAHLQELFSQQTGVWLQDHTLYSAIGTCLIMPQLLSPTNSRKLNILPYLLSHREGTEEESREAFLKRTCLCDFNWFLTKLQGTSIEDVFNDLKFIKDHDMEVDLVRDFMGLCGFGLQENPLSLSLQLLGTMPYMNAARYPLVAEMIETARAWMMDQKFPLLMPAFQCFPSPLNLCKAKLRDLTDIMAVDSTNQLGVVKTKDGHVEIWDLENKEWVNQLGVKFDKVNPNVFCTETKVLGVSIPHTLRVWEIETGFELQKVNLLDIFDENIANICCMAHSSTFDKVAFHTSDEDFNQTFVVLNILSGKILLKIESFDLKDEFFHNSSEFVTINDLPWVLFVYARSEMSDDKAVDIMKLSIYEVQSMEHKHTIICGEKKFHKLLTKSNKYAIICWQDCSFDVYDIEQGTLFTHLSAPDPRLALQSCSITEDGYLVVLASTNPSQSDDENIDDRNYHGLWFWNIEENSHSELLSQDHCIDDDVPKHFIIIEELHLAILGTPNSARITVWDLPTSECIHILDTNLESLDHIQKSSDVYEIYACSLAEKVVKIFDLYNLITCSKDTESQADFESVGIDIPYLASSRLPSARSDRTESILKRPGSRKSGRSTRAKSVRFAEDVHMEGDDMSVGGNSIDMLSNNDLLSVIDSISGNDSISAHDSIMDNNSFISARSFDSGGQPGSERSIGTFNDDSDWSQNYSPNLENDDYKPMDKLPSINLPMKEPSCSDTPNMSGSISAMTDSSKVASMMTDMSLEGSQIFGGFAFSSAGQVTMHSQLENMFDVTTFQFTKDSEFVITTTHKGLPTVWDLKTGFPHLHMERHAPEDEATPWAGLACKDRFIVGTTALREPPKEGWPTQYKLQIWTRETGDPYRPQPGMENILVTNCAVLHDKERVLVPVLDYFNPGDKAEARLKIYSVERLEVLHFVSVYLPQIPDELQVTDDCMYTILLNNNEESSTKSLVVYHLEGRDQFPQPCPYEFKNGTAYKKYGMTSNVILRNGISLAAGLNGDLQLWDIRIGEYEGNLYQDPSVKEKGNPSLHNHGGKQINHMVLSEDGRYLVCGAADGATSLWDLDNEMRIYNYLGHKDEVCRVAITWDNQLILTAGADRLLYVWPFAADRPLCILYIHVTATDLQISEDKRTVCVIGNYYNEPSRFMMFRLLNLSKIK